MCECVRAHARVFVSFGEIRTVNAGGDTDWAHTNTLTHIPTHTHTHTPNL